MAGFMKNMMSYVGMSDVQDDDDFVDSQTQDTSFDNDHSVAPMSLHNGDVAQSGNGASTRSNAGRMSRITTIHPKSYEDAQLVGRALRDGTPVVLNLTGVSESVAYRIVDFPAVLQQAVDGLLPIRDPNSRYLL